MLMYVSYIYNVKAIESVFWINTMFDIHYVHVLRKTLKVMLTGQQVKRGKNIFLKAIKKVNYISV